MPKEIFNFVKKKIDDLKPQAKRCFYYDQQSKGLLLVVYPSGVKSFYLYRRVNNIPERIFIGQYPETTIDQARQQAFILNAQIAQKINPADKKRSIKTELTFKELFEIYLERHAKPHKRSWKDDEA